MSRRDRMEAALAAGQVAAWEYDRAKRELRGSDALCELWGVDAGAPIDVYLQLVHDEDLPALRPILGATATNAAPTDIEFRLEHPVVGTRWIHMRAVPIGDGAGDIARWIGAVVDVTERRAAEDVLRESEQQLRELLESMPAIAVLMSAEGRVQYRNAYWRRMARGISETELARGAGVHPDDREIVFEAMRSEFRRGEPFERQYRLWDPDRNEYRWFLARWQPLRDSSGRITRWMVVAVDIQEQRIIEDALRDANELKDEFVALTSHELRSPLTVVLAAASRLARQAAVLSRDDIREQAEEIRQAGQRLSEVIENMLSLAFADRQEVKLETVSLAPLVDRCVAAHRLRYEQDVATDGAASVAPVRGSTTWVEQVLSNLLTNAGKYAAGAAVRVEVRQDGDEVAVRVLDRGSGVPGGEAERLFDAFYRAPKDAGRSPGAGLGLAVCRRLIAALGGRTWYAPREGGGSEFGFSLAVAEGEPEAAEIS